MKTTALRMLLAAALCAPLAARAADELVDARSAAPGAPMDVAFDGTDVGRPMNVETRTAGLGEALDPFETADDVAVRPTAPTRFVSLSPVSGQMMDVTVRAAPPAPAAAPVPETAPAATAEASTAPTADAPSSDAPASAPATGPEAPAAPSAGRGDYTVAYGTGGLFGSWAPELLGRHLLLSLGLGSIVTSEWEGGAGDDTGLDLAVQYVHRQPIIEKVTVAASAGLHYGFANEGSGFGVGLRVAGLYSFTPGFGAFVDLRSEFFPSDLVSGSWLAGGVGLEFRTE